MRHSVFKICTQAWEREEKDIESYKMKKKKEIKSLKRQSTDSHRLKGIKKTKSCKDGLYKENLDYVYYCVIFEVFDYRETFDSGDC